MAADPFAPLITRRKRKAAGRRLVQGLKRPFQRSRISLRRQGPPNLLMVGIDTLRADHLGAWGYARPTSPRLDQFASGGTMFADTTACAPWTLPSFASALTGVMPGIHGAYLAGPVRNMDTQPPGRLAAEQATLASYLKTRGYQTAAFYSNQFFAFGLAESFDHHQYLNDEAAEVIRVALDWIRRHADRPFFCFILVNDPHEPTTPAPADLELFLASATATVTDRATAPGAMASEAMLRGLACWGETPAPALGTASEPLDEEFAAALSLKLAIYDATIHQVDRAVGQMDDQLMRWGLGATTLRTVFSDHGEEFLDHLTWARRWNHDPRAIRGIGHGHTLFQELLHVPWLAWGAGVPAGVRRGEPVSLLDLTPTLLDWLGLPAMPISHQLPPELASLLTGRSQASDVTPATGTGIGIDTGTGIATGTGTGTATGRPLLTEALAYGPDLISVRGDRWKLIARRDGQPLALFDLETDGGEMTDISAQQPAVLAELQAIARRWSASGLGATGTGNDGSWHDMDAEIHQRLKDLGYSQ